MAREKTMRVVITFHTTTQAMKMEQCCRKKGEEGRLIPVPRQISAGCGMAWSAPAGALEGLKKLMEEENIEMEGLHELLL